MKLTRRHLGRLSAGLLSSSPVLAPAIFAPAILRAAAAQPTIDSGVTSGDVQADRALIWSRTNLPSRLMLRWRKPGGSWQVVRGPLALPENNFTARAMLQKLPPSSKIEYEAWFDADGSASAHAAGSLLTPALPIYNRPAEADVRFLWSGDTIGQGYGINPDLGGMRIYETMRTLQPDFFLHSGDTIYADGPVPAEIKLPDGSLWRNRTFDRKQKVAETLPEFWGAYEYNLLDDNLRRFQAEVPQVWQWDDHEVCNNWSASKDLQNDARYTVKDVFALAKRGRKAFLDFAPIGPTPGNNGVYRQLSYGPLLDLFVIDLRSFRGPNSPNRQETESPETTWLGRPQLDWLLRGLRRSRATWKVIATDMPLGLIVGDGKDKAGQPLFENAANGNGPALGRELEMARLLSAMQKAKIENVVWLTADVHYTAAHHYHPDRAQFKSFTPFWEFVSGPLNAGTFGPGQMEDTFGPEVVFSKHPPKGQGNLPPSAGYQFFGDVRIRAADKTMQVILRDLTGKALFTKDLTPAT